MTKADIVQAVYTKLGGFSKKEAADLVDQVFDSMKETLGRGEKIKISGFGNFVLRDKRQRQGRNPQTGEPIVITARRVLNFKASQLLKQALNEGLGEEWSESGGAAHGSAQNGHSSGVDGFRLKTGMDSGSVGSDSGGSDSGGGGSGGGGSDSGGPGGSDRRGRFRGAEPGARSIGDAIARTDQALLSHWRGLRHRWCAAARAEVLGRPNFVQYAPRSRARVSASIRVEMSRSSCA